ncbi:MAG: tetratricopeptide repeat protein [Gammaproteobacteria bacterium]|nr:tetratricopeptide repeat protein [Gammaproteobacteria bacterium]
MVSLILKWQLVSRLVVLLIGSLIISHSHAMSPNPRERIDFWRDNYTVLSEKNYSKTKQAQSIFRQLLNTAGHRRGIEPRLLIIKEDPNNISLPISIPDGWIILSKAVIDFCYQKNNQAGDARLAFVLAHELVHQLEDDFWHMKFFQALESAHSKDRIPGKIYSEVQNIAKQSDKILAKELRADELGIVYVAMAGYDSRAIVGKSFKNNFFAEWSHDRHPLRYTSKNTTNTHPDIKQRTTSVKVRLQQISEKSDYFKLGLWFYHSGDYERAIMSFDEFRRYFPGRAVHHNLASSYHRLAMRYYHAETNGKNSIQFQLSMLVDPESRASNATVRSNNQSNKLFSKHMKKAIHYYELALEQDPQYLNAYHNLSTAWLHMDEPYKAIAVLQDGLQLDSNNPGLLNNLGVAFHKAGNADKARQYLLQVVSQNKDYIISLFNLGIIAWQNNDRDKAESYWQTYLDKQPDRLWSNYLIQKTRLNLDYHAVKPVKPGREHVQKLMVGHYTNEISKTWDIENKSKFKLDTSTHQLIKFKNHVTTITEGDEIRLIATDRAFRGKSSQGIAIGDTIEQVIKRYGSPDYIDQSSSGQILAYPSQGISFQMSQNKVASWLLYWE